MIVVTSVRTDVAITVIEGGIFDPSEVAILKLAYDRAEGSLVRDYRLSEEVKARLAKIVLRIGRLSVATGRSLSVDPDVRNIASAASLQLQSLSADHGRNVVALVALFEGPRSHPNRLNRSDAVELSAADERL